MSIPRLTPLILALCLAGLVPAVLAAPPALEAVDPGQTHTSAPTNNALAKAAGDTLYILGGPDRGDGKFQDDNDPLIPDNEGWVPLGQFDDGTGPYWHISTFNAELLDPAPDNHAMWCGKYYLPCDTEPENPGYDDNILAVLSWAEPVPDPLLATQVRLTARLNYDMEELYDYLYLEVWQNGDWATLASWDGNNKVGGVFTPLDLAYEFTVQPTDYAGDLGDEIQLRWRFQSDAGWSDADCRFEGDGAAQVDNIGVSFDQGGGPQLMTFDDFEPGNPVHWYPTAELCSLAKVWTDLQDPGLCGGNPTPKLAFIDDGSACMSDGTWGTDWTYGPDGQVVYCPGFNLPYVDQFWSPAIDLPADYSEYDGSELAFDVFVHGTALGTVTLYWTVRYSPDGGTTWSAWKFFGVLYEQHGPEYRRYDFDISSLVPPDADKIQIGLGIFKFATFTNCSFVTPAPYYDNVALKIFKRSGPEIYHNWADNPIGLATGGFPTSGTLDLADPAGHSVDLPRSNNNPDLQVLVAANRSGSTLAGPPELHWRMQANPLYDAYRTAVVMNPVLGDSVAAPVSSDDRGGTKYSFLLPADGFFFPGDVLHYYFRAEDVAPSGNGAAIFPADTTGFSLFPGMIDYVPGAYPQDFEARALPTLFDHVTGEQPRILFWLDNTGTLELKPWLDAWARLGFEHGVDFDLYKAPWHVSPGATAEQLAGYDILVIATGRNASGSFTEDEILALEGWLAQGGKKLLLCGDNAVGYMMRFEYPFVVNTLGIDPWSGLDLNNVRPDIEDQEAPRVLPLAGNPLGLVTDFTADGSCYYNLFDAFATTGTGQAIYEWAAPDLTPGGYTPVAGVYNHLTAWDSHVVTLPFDLAFVQGPVGIPDKALLPRTAVLNEILTFFGAPGDISGTDIPTVGEFSVSSFPNPFNPQVQIAYTLPARGLLAVRIFNVRGELVRLLYQEMTPAGSGTLVWDGTGADGRPAPSGVYFCEVKAPQQRAVRKMALVR